MFCPLCWNVLGQHDEDLRGVASTRGHFLSQNFRHYWIHPFFANVNETLFIFITLWSLHWLLPSIPHDGLSNLLRCHGLRIRRFSLDAGGRAFRRGLVVELSEMVALSLPATRKKMDFGFLMFFCSFVNAVALSHFVKSRFDVVLCLFVTRLLHCIGDRRNGASRLLNLYAVRHSERAMKRQFLSRINSNFKWQKAIQSALEGSCYKVVWCETAKSILWAWHILTQEKNKVFAKNAPDKKVKPASSITRIADENTIFLKLLTLSSSVTANWSTKANVFFVVTRLTLFSFLSVRTVDNCAWCA